MNFGTPVPLMLGIILILCAVALFFLDKFRPGYERDADKIYAVLSLISGVFLLAHLTMDIIPAFQQLLMVGMVLTLLYRDIQSRTPRDSRAASPMGYDGPPERDRYRPRPPQTRGAYRSESRANLRAELDRGDYDYEDSRQLPQERPRLGSRGELDLGREDYSEERGYASRYPEDDRPIPRRDRSLDADYSGGRPYRDERLRRPKPSSRPRSGRYLLEPGGSSSRRPRDY